MNIPLIDYFLDPVLRGPTWGTLLMCIASSLMGVLLFLKKRTLIAESLSHASYPGVVAACTLFAFFFPGQEDWSVFPIFIGAFVSSFLGLKAVHWLEEKRKIPSDAALCFVLAVFFGIGIVAASGMQSVYPSSYKQIQILLFGQAATMSDGHIILYAGLVSLIILFLSAVFPVLKAALFDRDHAVSIGIPVKAIERIVFWLLLTSLIVGMRSVGIVLMSAMVIAPAVSARQFTDRLFRMFGFAALFGAISGLLGNILSVEASITLSSEGKKMMLPTGPSIVVIGGLLAFLSLLFAPKRGWLFRLGRIGAFKLRCIEENFVKGLWKLGPMSFPAMRDRFRIPSLYLAVILFRLKRRCFIDHEGKRYVLTAKGRQRGASIVRLHRLWELYLTQSLQFHVDAVHKTAEEMEHILTPDLEERLTRLLSNPKHDPHKQPIPERPN